MSAGNSSYLKYKLLKWAAILFCWPHLTGEVTVKFDRRSSTFTLISGGGMDGTK